jgi:hypothetical protein
MIQTEWQEVRQAIVEIEKQIVEASGHGDFVQEEDNELLHLIAQAWQLVNEKC